MDLPFPSYFLQRRSLVGVLFVPFAVTVFWSPAVLFVFPLAAFSYKAFFVCSSGTFRSFVAFASAFSKSRSLVLLVVVRRSLPGLRRSLVVVVVVKWLCYTFS